MKSETDVSASVQGDNSDEIGTSTAEMNYLLSNGRR
jgi:hypothetical protein